LSIAGTNSGRVSLFVVVVVVVVGRETWKEFLTAETSFDTIIHFIVYFLDELLPLSCNSISIAPTLYTYLLTQSIGPSGD
jgi:hypothetical protein